MSNASNGEIIQEHYSLVLKVLEISNDYPKRLIKRVKEVLRRKVPIRKRCISFYNIPGMRNRAVYDIELEHSGKVNCDYMLFFPLGHIDLLLENGSCTANVIGEDHTVREKICTEFFRGDRPHMTAYFNYWLVIISDVENTDHRVSITYIEKNT